jgi:hypothetical protein
MYNVSCLAEQAKILRKEAEDNKSDVDVRNERWARWHTCGLCEQLHHGVAYCALGWACWKTYVGRLETDQVRQLAMKKLGNDLSAADHDEDALSVQEAEFAMMRRLGASELDLLSVQGNLACTYEALGRIEPALCLRRDVYFGSLKVCGEENMTTVISASNYANCLLSLQHFEETKSLLLIVLPVARRVIGERNDLTLKRRWAYAEALYKDAGATLGDVREAVANLEETERIARRVLGNSHPITEGIGSELLKARSALRARETRT